MDKREAIPHDDARVVIPAHLRDTLQCAAEDKLQTAMPFGRQGIPGGAVSRRSLTCRTASYNSC
jgi:hypothetical protein